MALTLAYFLYLAQYAIALIDNPIYGFGRMGFQTFQQEGKVADGLQNVDAALDSFVSTFGRIEHQRRIG